MLHDAYLISTPIIIAVLIGICAIV